MVPGLLAASLPVTPDGPFSSPRGAALLVGTRFQNSREAERKLNEGENQQRNLYHFFFYYAHLAASLYITLVVSFSPGASYGPCPAPRRPFPPRLRLRPSQTKQTVLELMVHFEENAASLKCAKKSFVLIVPESPTPKHQ
ncbi:hypothetical protein BASA60_010837 [Batrachochytrium salamandrivorans]|nr:hypothetical protein BASA60_010837 [Batrachochytrium salamandrivorans]